MHFFSTLAGKWILASLALVAWAVSLGAGLSFLARYDTTAGQQELSPRHWPASSKIARPRGEWSLVMFLDPTCPCSRASLDELDSILSRPAAARCSAHVAFALPEKSDTPLEESFCWKRTANIPGAMRLIDQGSQEARRFRAQTSGYLALYDPNGTLQFHGGITGARGEVGDNAGREAVLQLLEGKPCPWHDHAVFGCALYMTSTPKAPTSTP